MRSHFFVWSQFTASFCYLPILHSGGFFISASSHFNRWVETTGKDSVHNFLQRRENSTYKKIVTKDYIFLKVMCYENWKIKTTWFLFYVLKESLYLPLTQMPLFFRRSEVKCLFRYFLNGLVLWMSCRRTNCRPVMHIRNIFIFHLLCPIYQIRSVLDLKCNSSMVWCSVRIVIQFVAMLDITRWRIFITSSSHFNRIQVETTGKDILHISCKEEKNEHTWNITLKKMCCKKIKK